MFSLPTLIWSDVQEKFDCPTDTYRTIEPNLSAPIHMVAHSVIRIHIHAYMRSVYTSHTGSLAVAKLCRNALSTPSVSFGKGTSM